MITVLHVLVASRPPLDLVRKVVELAPETVYQLTNEGASPLQWASKVFRNQDVVNSLFFHLCCLARDQPYDRIKLFQIIQDWFDTSTDRGTFIAATRYRNRQENTLHVIVAARPPLDLVKRVVEYAPETVDQRTKDGRSPLGIARQVDGNADVVKYLESFFEDFEDELYNLCKNARDASGDARRNDAFNTIRKWLANDQNPREIKARYTYEVDKSTPLHLLVAANPPLDLVEHIIDLAPETVGQRTNGRRTPLDIASKVRENEDVVKYLRLPQGLYNLCVRARDSTDNERENAFQIIRDWLTKNQDLGEVAAHYTNEVDNSTPLHVLVASPKTPLDLVKTIIDLAPERVGQHTKDRFSPSGIARKKAAKEVFDYLLKCEKLYDLCLSAWKSSGEKREAALQNIRDWLRVEDKNLKKVAARFKDQNNCTPLYLLVYACAPSNLVEQIVNLAPEALYQLTTDDMPLHIALEYEASSPDVYAYFKEYEQLYNLCKKAQDASVNQRDTFKEIQDWLTNNKDLGVVAANYRIFRDLSTPLHVLVAARPHLDLVKQIIKLAPEAVYKRATDGRSPLDIAREVSGNEDVVNYLRLPQGLYNLCVSARDTTDNERENAFQIIRDWLTNNKDLVEAAAHYKNEVDNSTPLHVLVASPKTPLDLVKTIIDLAPKAVYQLTLGELPLDIARRVSENQAVVHYLRSLQELYNLCVSARDTTDNEREKAFQIIRNWLTKNQDLGEVAAHYTNEVDNSTPLHVLVASPKAPLDLVKTIIDLAPERVGQHTKDCFSPSGIARKKATKEVFDYLLKCEKLYDLCLSAWKSSGEKREAALQNIRDWLRVEDKNLKKVAARFKDQNNCTPLPLLVAVSPPRNLVEQIVNLAPEVVHEKDDDGNHPFKYLLTDDVDVVTYLGGLELFNVCLQAWEATLVNKRVVAFQKIQDWLSIRQNPLADAVRYRNQQRNSIALHVLVGIRPPLDLVKRIIELAPEAVLETTTGGRFPLHIAIESKASPEVVQLLVSRDSVKKKWKMVGCLYILQLNLTHHQR